MKHAILSVAVLLAATPVAAQTVDTTYIHAGQLLDQPANPRVVLQPSSYATVRSPKYGTDLLRPRAMRASSI